MSRKGIAISFASGRDGTGKSTICANLGVALSQMGLKPVVVDADVEGASISLLFGLDFDVSTIHDFLAGRSSAEDVTFHYKQAGVDLVVGSIKVESLKDIKFELLKDLIVVLKEKFDIVVVDIPAGLSIDTMTALSASDVAVLVVTPDILSVVSALKTKVITKGRDIEVLGVIANKTGGEYDIPTAYIEDMLGVSVLGNVEDDDAIRKSLSKGEILLIGDNTSPAAKSIKKIAKKLVGESK